MAKNLPRYIITSLKVVCEYCESDDTYIEAGKKPNGEPMIILSCSGCHCVAEYALSELEQQEE